MPEKFDPYHKWLGIPPKDQPPNHYRLLGIELFESDADVIATAVRPADGARENVRHRRLFRGVAADSQSACDGESLPFQPGEKGGVRRCARVREEAAASSHGRAAMRPVRPRPGRPLLRRRPDFEFIHQPAKPSQKPPQANYLFAAITGACVVLAAILVLAFAFSRGGREVADGDPLKAKKNIAVEPKVAAKTTPKGAGAKVDHKVGPMVEPEGTAEGRTRPARAGEHGRSDGQTPGSERRGERRCSGFPGLRRREMAIGVERSDGWQ